MRTLFLATASLLVLSGGAYASGDRDHGRRHHGPRAPQTVEDYYAAALAVNIGQVSGNESRTGRGESASVSMRGGFSGMRGVANVNQNAGANSVQQNAVAVAYIEGCDCEVTVGSPRSRSRGDADANAVAGNGGQVVGSSSANGEERRHGDRRHGGSGDGTEASVAMNGSFNSATGVVQVNQNAGANSGQQNATSVVYVDGIRGQVQDRDAWAISANLGDVSGNRSRDAGHAASAGMTGAFTGFTGAANVNQNAGANSLQQNATSLAAITYCNCAAQDLSTTIAAAGNFGGVTGNYASASGGSATVTMANSFNGLTGVAQVNQNAGANSLMQNTIAVGAIYNR
jgi:hypothetical protein